MKIAIHHKKNGFSSKWIEYCRENNIDYKIVNCYSNDIILQLEDCDALMWHFHHASYKDALFAKQLIYSVQTSGMKVFPDFHTCWHFDDKIGQKYLLEANGIPMPSSYIFYEKQKALEWVKNTSFPKIFKLRRGAGSAHVVLVKNKHEARKIIKKAFTKGFGQYNAVSNLRERWRKFKLGKTTVINLAKGVVRLGYTTQFDKIIGKEKGYVYFQDFIDGNSFDIRVTHVNGRCFAVRRKVRNGDFRASGSGIIDYDLSKIPREVLKISFRIVKKLKLHTAAFDFIIDQDEPMLLELSYGFGHDDIPLRVGYWDSELNFHKEEFNPYGWMVRSLFEEC